MGLQERASGEGERHCAKGTEVPTTSSTVGQSHTGDSVLCHYGPSGSQKFFHLNVPRNIPELKFLLKFQQLI